MRPQREIDLTLPPRSTGGVREDHREHLDPGGGAERGVEVAAYGIGVVGEQEQDVAPAGVGGVDPRGSHHRSGLALHDPRDAARPRTFGHHSDRFGGDDRLLVIGRSREAERLRHDLA